MSDPRTHKKETTKDDVLNGVNIGLVAEERLDALAGADIPDFGGKVAGARDKDVLLGEDGQAHDITSVIQELDQLCTGLDIPEKARDVAGGGQDLLIVQEAAAREVARVRAQFASDANRTLFCLEVVDRANVVQTTAGNIVSGRGILEER